MNTFIIMIDGKAITRLACIGLAVYAWKKLTKGVNDELN